MILKKIKAFLYSIFLIFSIFIVIVFMFLFKKHNRKIRRIWAKSQRFFLRYKIYTQGNSHPEANLIIMNHQSILDIVVLEEIHPKNLCWIAKKEIDKIPIIRYILTIPKMISVDRKNPRELVRIVHEAKERIEHERVIAMFPEGTRRHGEKLLKFQNGAKVLADKLNLKVQPVVLLGTKKILNSHDFTVDRGDVKIIYLDLVDIKDKNWLEKTRELMQKIIDKERDYS